MGVAEDELTDAEQHRHGDFDEGSISRIDSDRDLDSQQFAPATRGKPASVATGDETAEMLASQGPYRAAGVPFRGSDPVDSELAATQVIKVAPKLKEMDPNDPSMLMQVDSDDDM
jgi:hypothetical protein